MLTRLFIEVLLRLLRGQVGFLPKQALTKEVEDGLMAQMWENPAFRKRVADRDAKLIYTMAGGEGMEPEPRDKYSLHAGQRVEVLLWARDAKAAYQRLERSRTPSVTTAQEPS